MHIDDADDLKEAHERLDYRITETNALDSTAIFFRKESRNSSASSGQAHQLFHPIEASLTHSGSDPEPDLKLAGRRFESRRARRLSAIFLFPDSPSANRQTQIAGLQWHPAGASGRNIPCQSAGARDEMARSTQRVLKRRGRVSLIETANPATGVGYSVKIGSLRLWSGQSLSNAEKQFEQATSKAPD